MIIRLFDFARIDVQRSIDKDPTYNNVYYSLMNARREYYFWLVEIIEEALERNNLVEIDGRIERKIGG